MLARFWGTRGSLPVALTSQQVNQNLISAVAAAQGRSFSNDDEIARFVADEMPFDVAGTYGGSTSCVQLDDVGDEYIICDMGSGVREFGNAVLSGRWPGRKSVFHVFMSHGHWDHIMGFPFFTPIYVPGNKIIIYGCHDQLEEIFRCQQSRPYFPVDFSELAAEISFVTLPANQVHDIAGLKVKAIKQHHDSDSYAYRFEHGGKSVVYSTDGEYRLEDLPELDEIVEFIRAADLLIFDAMYSLADAATVRADWGHSNNIIAVELAQRAQVKNLCLFHHEPSNGDAALFEILQETKRYLQITAPESELQVTMAFDGLDIAL